MYLPQARYDELIVRELADETLVYDQERNKAHCLNSTVALVWRMCDGIRSPAALCKAVEKMLNFKGAEALVQLALEQLGRRNLLTEAPAPLARAARATRRAALQQMVSACVALPFIRSITAKPQISY